MTPNVIRRFRLPIVMTMMFAAVFQTQLQSTNAAVAQGLFYPPAEKGDTVDKYGDVSVTDPYRWLEDTDSAKTKEWIAKENRVTESVLETVPERETIKSRLTEIWNFETCTTPFNKGGHVFLSKNNGLQNQSVFYVKDTPAAPPRVLIDPNSLSKDGTVALSGARITDDGKLCAYGLSASGSDWKDWYVKDVATGKDLADHIKWSKDNEVAWTSDGKGFYYTRYTEPKSGAELTEANYYQKLYFHKLGTDQAKDKLIYERNDQKEWEFSPTITDDGRYLVVSIFHGTSPKNGLLVQDLNNPKSTLIELFTPGTTMRTLAGNDGSKLFFLTDDNAPRAKVVTLDVGDCSKKTDCPQADIVKEADDTLEDVSIVNNKIICKYLKDAYSDVRIYTLKGDLDKTLKLPGIGTAIGFTGKQSDLDTYYTYTSFTATPTVYHLSLTDYAESVFFKPSCKFNPSELVTEQIFYTSKDGTKIPMFLSHKKELRLTADNPVYLYAYGGFKISITPSFSPSNVLWMERGGIFAVPSLRGGGEFGESWHEAGMKHKKQNVFDDFIAAAETLIAKRYTSKEKLAIGGGSNGGLLVGACITQRPDLFGAAIAQVGVMDMLRFNKFTVGWGWVQEYGSPEDAEDFKTLYKYSPLHNIKKGTCYPPTMITTADHDDRVIPGHSFKFAAAMQEAQGCNNPIIIRIDTKAGHGGGKPTSKLIDEATDKWSFLVKELSVVHRNIHY